MAKTEQFTSQQVADALTQAKGFVSIAAHNLGCVDRTVRNYMEKYTMCKQACLDSREKMIDVAEGKLFENINKGDSTSIIFFLKTQAIHRSDSSRTIWDTLDNGNIHIRLERP